MTDITRQAADSLLAFLPGFEQPGRSFFAEDPASTRYPIYAEDVLEFIRVAGSPPWCDYAYEPNAAYAMLMDDRTVAAASIDEVRTMLTCFVRSERFGDGAWSGLLEKGRVVALLRRLRELRDSLDPG